MCPHAVQNQASTRNDALPFGRSSSCRTTNISFPKPGALSLARFLLPPHKGHGGSGVFWNIFPTRPPAEPWAQPPSETVINRAYQVLSEKVDPVEYLIGYEGNAFACTGDVEEDLLSITAVHPMREDAVDAFLARAGADGSVVQQLVDRGQLIETEYGERTFYMRKLHLGASEA